MKLKRRSIIHVDTNQACQVTLEFVPGAGGAYIHFNATDISGYKSLSGFIADKDVKKFKRFAESLPVKGGA